MARIFIIPNEEEQEIIWTAPLDATVINLGDGLEVVIDPIIDIGIKIDTSGIGAILEISDFEISLNVETFQIDCILVTGLDVKIKIC